MTSTDLLPIMFKVYLKNNDGSTKEIRRFNTETNARGDFNYVCEKLKQFFPELRDNEFTIAWIDEDKDEIRISSDQELAVAIKCNSDQLKLYVHLCWQNEKCRENQIPKEEGVCHFGVLCDGCDGLIKGFRYKCIQCKDYDLCSQCETLGLHTNHCMIRISHPRQWSSHRDRRLLHDIRKLLKKNDLHLNKEDIPNKFDKSCPMSRRCHEFSAPDYNNIFSWLEAFAPNFSNVFEKMTEERSDDAGPSNEGTKQKDKDNLRSCHRNGTEIFKEDLLRVLNWFGLDVNVETSSDTLNISQTNKTKEREECQTNITTSQTGTEKIPEENTELVIDSTNETFTSDDALVSSTETTVKRTEGTGEWTILDKIDTSDISSTSSISSGLNNLAEKQVSANTSLAPSPPKEVDTPDRTIYPQLPKEEENIYHPNPKIREALKTMIAMGFSNKSGLLTYLLEAENGNINKVSDLLLS